MEYLDFELRIMPGAGREYPVSVLQSPAGETTATMRFPFDTLALQNQLQGIEIAVLRSGGTRRDVASDEHLMGVSEFGRKLFESLMTDTVRETFRRSQDRARILGKGLRLRLRIEAPELASLPWEYLYDPAEGDYVCLSTDTPVVRYLEFDRPPEALTIQPPLSILGVIASPSDRAALDVTREKQRVEAATAGLRDAGLLRLTWLGGSTWRDLQKAMRQGPYHIFHFIGHGGFDSATGEGVIALTDDQNKSALMSATQLGRLLSDHQSLRMVVLNSCLGAKGSSTDVFSSTASILVRRGVSAVVAMQYEISDLAAVEFARSLYEALADGIPVDAAVAEARKAISLSVNNTVEWGTPVLYMRSPDGRLFRIDGITTSRARASGTYQPTPSPVVEPSRESTPTPSPPRADLPRKGTTIPGPRSRAASSLEGEKRPRALLVGLVALVALAIPGAYFLFRGHDGDHHDNGAHETGGGNPSGNGAAPLVQVNGGHPPDTNPHTIVPPSPHPAVSLAETTHAPVGTETKTPWELTNAHIRQFRAEFLSPGEWNLIMTVDYAGPTTPLQATVDCALRKGEPEAQSVQYLVPLLRGRLGGDYVARLRTPHAWEEREYPITCTVGGVTKFDGRVQWSPPPIIDTAP